MTRIVIAGVSNDPEFAKIEMLGHYLAKNLPDFQIQIVMKKSQQDWSEFVSLVYQENQWQIRPAKDRKMKSRDELKQLVWVYSGELIGNANDYIKWIQKSYNATYELTNELLQEIAAENHEIAIKA